MPCWPQAGHAQRPQAGFTLIEVLVAITLMALVTLMAWRGLNSVAATRAWLDRDARDNDVVVRTLGQIGRDLELSQGGLNADNAARPDHPLPPGVDVVVPLGLPPELNVVRPTPADDGKWQRITWKIHDGALWRYTGTGGDHYPLPAPTTGAALMPGVTRLDMRLWMAGHGWEGLKPSTPGKATGIEIIIERMRDGRRERYTRVVELG